MGSHGWVSNEFYHPSPETVVQRETRDANVSSDDSSGHSVDDMALTRQRTVRLGLAVSLLYAAFVAYRIAIDSFVVGDIRYYNVLDDSLISMRYGWNLAHGYGVVWNPGERIEGYSNPLLVLVGAALTVLAPKTTAVLLLQLLGACWVLAAAWLAAAIAIDLSRALPTMKDGGRLSAAVVLAATLAYYPLFILSLQGMETGLLTMLILLAVRLSFQPHASTRTGGAAAVSGVLALAYLCRPDGALPALAIAACLGLAAVRNPGNSRAQSLRVVAACTAPIASVVGLHLLWRRSYYESWLPNTYALKIAGVPVRERIADGVAFVDVFLVETALLIALGILGLVLGRTRKHALLAVLFVVQLAYYVFAGGDFVPDLWRFIVPGMPMLFILAVDGALRGWGLLWSQRGPGALAWAPILVVVVALCMASQRYSGLWLEDSMKQMRQRRRDTAAARVIEVITTGDAVVGVFAAGYIPYYSGRRGVDFLGKMDPTIAKGDPHRDVVPSMISQGARMWPGHAKYDLQYSVMKLKPDVVERMKWFDEDLRGWGIRHYRQLKVGPNSLYLRKESTSIHWDLMDCQASECRIKTPG